MDVDDEELAHEVTKPWKYFVLFVSVDRTGRNAAVLDDAIQRKTCLGHRLRFFFNNLYIDRHPDILWNVVVVFTPQVKVREVTRTALCCVSYNYSWDDFRLIFGVSSTAGLSFAADNNRYIATSLHGQMLPSREDVDDAFTTDDGELRDASQVGYLVCDWKNDFVDVALIQLLDEHKSGDVGRTEEQVVKYMKAEMKATYAINSTPTRVHIHSASCFRGRAGDGPIPGTILEVRSVVSDRHCYNWHLLVQLDDGFQVELGQSGSAVTRVNDGRPIGMLVARLETDHSIAIVTPLHHIHASLNRVKGHAPLLSLYNECPVTVAEAELSTTRITDSRAYCLLCKQPYKLKLWPLTAQVDSCCTQSGQLAATRLANKRTDLFLSFHKPNSLPTCCQYWLD